MAKTVVKKVKLDASTLNVCRHEESGWCSTYHIYVEGRVTLQELPNGKAEKIPLNFDAEDNDEDFDEFVDLVIRKLGLDPDEDLGGATVQELLYMYIHDLITQKRSKILTSDLKSRMYKTTRLDLDITDD